MLDYRGINFITQNTYIISFPLQHNRDTWEQTVISYTTDKSIRIPIADILLRDVSKPNQSFYVEIGPACFT